MIQCIKNTLKNHPSEWQEFYDEKTGTFRYRHKGSGIVRNTLMAIGKMFGKAAASKAKDISKKAVQTAVAKTGKKIGEKVTSEAVKAGEKGGAKIQQLLQRKRPMKKQQDLAASTPPLASAPTPLTEKERKLRFSAMLAQL